MVGRWISFWDGPISGAVLVSGRVKERSLDGQFVWFLLSQRLPSCELSHILSQRYFWVDDFPFPKGYVSSLKSNLTKLLGDSIFVGFYDQDFSCQTWQRLQPAKKLQSCYYRWVGVSKSQIAPPFGTICLELFSKHLTCKSKVSIPKKVTIAELPGGWNIPSLARCL